MGFLKGGEGLGLVSGGGIWGRVRVLGAGGIGGGGLPVCLAAGSPVEVVVEVAGGMYMRFGTAGGRSGTGGGIY